MYTYFRRLIDDGTYCLTNCNGSGEEAILSPELNISIVSDDIFKGNKELIRAVFPDTIKEIGGFVFDGCENLKQVKLPSHLRELWQYALTRCGIEEIVLPGSLERIAFFTFYQCKQLRKVTLHKGTKKILAWAFKDCANLKDVYLPDHSIEINENAFEGCPLVTLHYGDNE